jgi:hypothetical protein
MVTRILIALCLLATVAQGQVVRKILRPDLGAASEVGLVGRWCMEEKLVISQISDKSGNGNIAYNATGTSLVGGNLGRAALFTGSEYLTVPDIGTTVATNHSIVAWVFNRNTFPNGQAPIIFAQRQGYNRAQLYLNTANQLGYVDWKADRNERVNILAGLVPQNRWSMVVATTDNSTGIAAIYINGQRVASTNYTGVMSQNSIESWIGWEGASGNTDRKWRGMMDEVRYYSRPLAAAEIKALYYSRRPTQ